MTYVIYKNIAVLKTQTSEEVADGKVRVQFVSDSSTRVKSVSFRLEGRGEIMTMEPITRERGDVYVDIPVRESGIYTVELNTIETAGEEGAVERSIDAQSLTVDECLEGKLICAPLMVTSLPTLWNAMGVILEMLIGHIDEHRNGYEVV